MTQLSKNEQVANIVAFLTILFGEDSAFWDELMTKSPNYIIEKFMRYILSTRVEYPWGMHLSLRDMRFQRYVDKWELELTEDE